MKRQYITATIATLVALGGLKALAEEPEPPKPETTVVWPKGDSGYYMHRIPAIVLTKDGTLLAFAEGRKKGRSDWGDIDLVMKRSTDGGKTWSDEHLIYEEGGTNAIVIGGPKPAVDPETGTIHLMFGRRGRNVARAEFVSRSDDDGLTWSEPREVSDMVRPEGAAGVGSPGHGIVLRNGKYAGRICMPVYFQYSKEYTDEHPGVGGIYPVMVYSDDGGETWTHGEPSGTGLGECNAAELPDGSIIMTARQYRRAHKWCRAIVVSKDGGETWSEPEFRRDLPCCDCHGSILSAKLGSDHVLLHANPVGPGERRKELTVRLSRDGGKTWPSAWVLEPRDAQYSDMVAFPDGTIGCLFERGNKYRTAVTFARFPVEWVAGK